MSPRKTTKRRSQRRKRPPGAAWWTSQPAWIAIAVIAVLALLWWSLQPEESGFPGAGDGVETVLRSLAESHGVTGDGIEADVEIRKTDGVFVRTWRIRFPNSAAREEFIAEVAILGDRDEITVAAPEKEVGKTIGLRIDHGFEAFDLDLVVAPGARSADERPVLPTQTPVPATPTPRPPPPPDARGMLAILLDDAGQRLRLTELAINLPPEVGVAVLPFLPASTESAVALHEAGHEVWLHLPMEAVSGKDPGPGALMVSMSDQELHDAVYMAINNIPHLVGVNNHMGSLATANLRMMTWVMQDLAAMDLAFLDSRTTVSTVAEEAARAQGVRTGRRHVFLDNERTKEAVQRQLDEAVYRALMEGEAIAIGHLNEVTVAVLERELPDLNRRGVTLVRPTALLR